MRVTTSVEQLSTTLEMDKQLSSRASEAWVGLRTTRRICKAIAAFRQVVNLSDDKPLGTASLGVAPAKSRVRKVPVPLMKCVNPILLIRVAPNDLTIAVDGARESSLSPEDRRSARASALIREHSSLTRSAKSHGIFGLVQASGKFRRRSISFHRGSECNFSKPGSSFRFVSSTSCLSIDSFKMLNALSGSPKAV